MQFLSLMIIFNERIRLITNDNELNMETNFHNAEGKINNAIKLNYAKFMQRVLAYIIDFIVIGGICFLEFAIIGQAIKNRADHRQLLLIDNYAATLTSILYFSIMESSSKQATIGKKVIGIYVTDLSGNRITFLKALLRVSVKFIGSLIQILYSVIYPVDITNTYKYLQQLGYLLMLVLPKKQALHDVVAGTVVLSKTDETDIS